ncbi:MAG: long-chain fatty acid--CoA ligase [Terriglobales bacterium]|jgi:fatty-acyl-CoA synthase
MPSSCRTKLSLSRVWAEFVANTVIVKTSINSMLHGDILGERARISPEKTALICVSTRQRLTYRELNQRAIQCAHLWLSHCGLQKGDRVAILAKNRLEFLDAFFAAAKSGIILVPLNVRLTPAELSLILKSSGATALLYDGELAANVLHLKIDPAISQQVTHWIALDPPADSSELDYARLRTTFPTDWDRPHCDAEDIYCLLYTSGTTGKPKGVMIPHRMIAWNGYNTAINWQLRDSDISPVFTPLYHAGGLAAFLVPIVAAGGVSVLHRDFDASEVWRTLEREKCTVMLGVPTIYKMLLDAPEAASANLTSIRWFISGGAPLPIELVDAYRRRGIVLKQGYGLTEVGVNCFTMSEAEALTKLGSIGRPMMFTEAKLIDADGNSIPSGRRSSAASNAPSSIPALAGASEAQQGELCLRGPHVCKGYWQDPAATSAVLDEHGWFHTGDIARRDPDGFFYIVGRSKDMFISGGVNVYPAEIEAELLRHPNLADAAVIGVPHPTWGEVGVAFVVPVANATPSPDEIVSFLAGKLAKYKLPRQFLFVKVLARSAYGKVLKSELRELFEQSIQTNPDRGTHS